MKILVTGGRGYVARNIADKLRTVGHDVLAPFRDELDMTDYKAVAKYFDKHQPEAVVHAASKGGMRGKVDTLEDFTQNILMYESLEKVLTADIPVVFYTSGADFDRRNSIEKIVEREIIHHWPIDPYGLSKNIIVRRILEKQRSNYHILRIFAVFNEDETDTRYIKRSILNIKEGKPIEIHQNKEMDFFYMDDLFTVTESLLTHVYGNAKHLNMSYVTKHTLFDVSDLIKKCTKDRNPSTILLNMECGPSYSGSGFNLSGMRLPMIGLEEGIRRTINKLL